MLAAESASIGHQKYANNLAPHDDQYCRVSSLPEFDSYGFGIGAQCAFKSSLVAAVFSRRVDLRKKHYQTALRAAPVPNRRVTSIEIMWLRHSTLPV